jgi:hypothetical protein
MSDGDRIDIVVTDGIDPNVDKKLRSIADNADRGAASVLRLKAELASITATPVAKLQAATATSTATINKQLASQSTLTKATSAGASEDVKAAASKGRLTAAIDAEAAAQARLAAVIDKTIARQAAAQAASGATTFAKGGNPFQGEANLAAQAASVGAATRAMNAEVAAAEVASVGSFGRIKNAAMNAFDFMRDAAYAQASNFKGFFGSGGAATIEKEAAAVTKAGTAAKVNSRAISELFVLGREASRGNFTRMAGSVTVLASALGLLETVLVPLAIVAGIAGAALFGFKASIQGDADKQLKDYSTSLGLTSKEMRKLGDETVGAKGKIEQFNSIKLTFGDVFHGLTKTIQDTFNLSPTLQKMKNDVLNALAEQVKLTQNDMAQVYGFFYSAYKNVGKVWSGLPAMIGEACIGAANAAIEAIEGMVNKSIDAINGLANGANSILNKVGLGNLFGQVDHQHLTRIKSDVQGTTAAIRESIASDYSEGFNRANKAMSKFMRDWKANSIQAGKDRLKEMADAIKGNRNPKKETDPKTKDDYLNDTNSKLDMELSRMHMLKDAREEQQRLDQIEEEFIKRRQPLTQSEIEGFRAKIHAIQEFKLQQAEMDRIYEAATGPLKTYQAALKAIDDLLGRHAITQQRAAQETVLAARAYQEATDPLFALKEQMQVATIAAQQYGDAAQQNSYYEQIRQAFLKQGIELSYQYVAGVNAEVDALMRKNNALQQQTYVQQQVGGVINPILQDAKFLANKQNFYAEIDRLRKLDVFNEQTAQQAKYAIQAKYDQIRLSGASQFFGVLAGLSSSGNKKLAAIGKAAAIAQATIDGIMAVQKALATLPPPWSFAVAGAVAAMTGVNIAKIISTPTGGFMEGGYTGDGDPRSVAGVVHGREYVFDADATRRIGVQRLEAIRQGRAASPGRAANDGGGRPRVTVHQHPGTVVETRERSDGEIEIIARRVVRTEVPKVNQQQLADPNSPTSKALTRHTNAGRTR